MRGRRGIITAATAVLIVACSAPTSPSVSPVPTIAPPPFGTPATGQPIEVFAAGDIAGCDTTGDEATADLLDQLVEPGDFVLALGDLAYPDGSIENFAECYDPTWGRWREQTLPTPGNHEYHQRGAAPYFAYFGAVAGFPDVGFTSWDFGPWVILSLNSNCREVAGGCGTAASQTILAAEATGSAAETTPPRCVLAMWHHPRWSSGGEHGSDNRTEVLWRTLALGGADIVLSGHDHDYERFVPMDGEGEPVSGGLVQFVVGTGGRSLYQFRDILATSAVHDDSTFGVLHLTLRSGGYDWEFVPTTPGGFTEAGSATC